MDGLYDNRDENGDNKILVFQKIGGGFFFIFITMLFFEYLNFSHAQMKRFLIF